MSYTPGVYIQSVVDEVKACARTLEASVGGVRARVGGSSELADLFAAGVGECRWTQGKSCVVKNEKERTIDGPPSSLKPASSHAITSSPASATAATSSKTTEATAEATASAKAPTTSSGGADCAGSAGRCCDQIAVAGETFSEASGAGATTSG